MKRLGSKAVANLALAAILIVLLVLTLSPSSSGTIDFRDLCIICGERGLADAILNVFLFMPLGMALGARFRSNALAYALALGLSTSIEIAQVFIPGRDSSLADILFNGLGSVLGVGIARSWRLLLSPAYRTGRRLAVSAALAAVLVFVATDLLLRPAFPIMQYDAAWTPRLRHLEQYEGSVLDFAVGDVRLPHGLLSDSDGVRELLNAGAPLRVTAIAGAAPSRLAPLAQVDGFQASVVSFGVDRFNLSYRYRMRADDLRLDRPELQLRNGLVGIRPGEVFTAEAEREGETACLAVNDARSCGLGFTIGDGWSLLLWSGRFPAWLPPLLGLAWLAAVGLPVAFWAPNRREALLLGSAIAAAAFLIPRLGPLLATPWQQIAAILVGFSLGLALRQTRERAEA